MNVFRKIFGPPDIEKLKEKANIKRLLKAARHKNIAIQNKALDALKSLGDRSIPFLLAKLKAPNEFERREAAEVLEKLGWNPRSDEELVSILIAQNNWEAIAAMDEAAVSPLMSLLNDGQDGSELCAAIAGALCIASNPRAVESLAKMLERGGSAVASLSQLGLGRMGGAAVERVIAILKNRDLSESTWISAAQTLGMIGEPAVEPLIQYLNFLRTHAAQAPYELNGVILALAFTADPRAIEALRIPLRTSDPELHEVISLLLKAFEAPPNSIINTLRHPNPGLRLAATMALGNLKESSGIADLAHVLNDQYPEPRVFAAVALGKIGGSSAASILINHLQGVQPQEKEYTIVTLSDIANSVVVDSLLPYLKGTHTVNRALAAFAIERIKHVIK